MKTIEETINLLLFYENDAKIPESSLAAMRVIVSDIYGITTLELKKLIQKEGEKNGNIENKRFDEPGTALLPKEEMIKSMAEIKYFS